MAMPSSFGVWLEAPLGNDDALIFLKELAFRARSQSGFPVIALQRGTRLTAATSTLAKCATLLEFPLVGSPVHLV
jgi:hypothetical protein